MKKARKKEKLPPFRPECVFFGIASMIDAMVVKAECVDVLMPPFSLKIPGNSKNLLPISPDSIVAV